LMRTNLDFNGCDAGENQAFKAGARSPIYAPMREREQKIARARDIHICKILRRFWPYAVKHCKIGKQLK
ncbi:MAG: hypothetical protein KAS85_06060, partial [Rhodobacteraceae bacterium]|nr:hypothetical protein [Paracoccaceae bacterium]